MNNSHARLARLEGDPRFAPPRIQDLPPEERRARLEKLLPEYLSHKTALEVEAIVAAASALREPDLHALCET